MTRNTIAAGLIGILAGTASAETIGVSMALFDDNFLTVLRNGMIAHAQGLEGVDLQVEDAQNDVGRQLNQIENFIAAGVDAIIVNPVDTSATQAMTDAAAAAGVPLVFVNRMPINLESLPDNQAFVGSNERDSGTLQGTEVCRLLREQGTDPARVILIMGELSNEAAITRSQMIRDTVAREDCAFMEIVEEQTGNWNRQQGADLMTNWLGAGVEFDAVVSNNDEMAIGAIQSLKAAGISMDDVIVAGIDATQDALAAMQAGDLDVTVFQDAAGQGAGAVDTALALARGEEVAREVWIPFELVTPENIDGYLTRN
ncbi:sugar ABC transporter substrate-binding protein [Rubellimicrobium sp. CFH 75288]|uniref:sugar ABC transporter substrate-binding protein n=1 Tax=Rubellimicrobium sp. CFH 75288 TaxID=2697034 RepID=UPI001411BE42|nr:sugar ABC transporter substrate-binding protein [Rubellimicrobium sp. CFH 75288]NAZ36129.1 substrate-binding domain-containing protein [Rubellimicrobium sp. CFH 75288]